MVNWFLKLRGQEKFCYTIINVLINCKKIIGKNKLILLVEKKTLLFLMGDYWLQFGKMVCRSCQVNNNLQLMVHNGTVPLWVPPRWQDLVLLKIQFFMLIFEYLLLKLIFVSRPLLYQTSSFCLFFSAL